MAQQSWKDASKINWTSEGDGNGFIGENKIAVGCLMRIASATESMARSHADLIAEAERFKKWYHEEKARREKLQRQVNAYKGIIKRMKREP